MHRNQFVLKAFQSDPRISLVGPSPAKGRIGQALLRKLGLDRLLWLLALGFHRPDYLWLLAMNSPYPCLFRVAKSIGTKIIVDFYSPRATINTTDRKINESAAGRARLKRLTKGDQIRICASSKVLFLTAQEAEYWTPSCPGGTHGQSYIVPLVVPNYHSHRRRPKSPGEQFEVFWWGKMSGLHGLSYLVQEFMAFARYLPTATLKLYDDSPARVHHFQTWLDERYPYVAHKTVSPIVGPTYGPPLNDVVESADLAIGPVGFTELGLLSVPNKVVEAWALGIPVLTQESIALPDEAHAASFLLKSNKPGELTALLKLAHEHLGNPSNTLQMMRAGRRLHQEFFSEERFLRNVEPVLFS